MARKGNLFFLLQQLKKLEDDSATLKLQNAVNEKMNSVIYDTSGQHILSFEADEESAAETISVYDVRQSWDLSRESGRCYPKIYTRTFRR